jgi:hypothetical protein
MLTTLATVALAGTLDAAFLERIPAGRTYRWRLDHEVAADFVAAVHADLVALDGVHYVELGPGLLSAAWFAAGRGEVPDGAYVRQALPGSRPVSWWYAPGVRADGTFEGRLPTVIIDGVVQ